MNDDVDNPSLSHFFRICGCYSTNWSKVGSPLESLDVYFHPARIRAEMAGFRSSGSTRAAI